MKLRWFGNYTDDDVTNRLVHFPSLQDNPKSMQRKQAQHRQWFYTVSRELLLLKRSNVIKRTKEGLVFACAAFFFCELTSVVGSIHFHLDS